MKNIALITMVMAVAACSQKASYNHDPMTKFDRHTQYAVAHRLDGFDLTISYSLFQLAPDEPALTTACKAALTSVAREIAKQRGTELYLVDEFRTRLSMGRDGLTSLMHCSVTAPVDWKT